ncbi:MAG: DUF1778 domain-containing protein [Proteobacteria bacterium]|nr:DUF1778 domain-containing protein [Pseudomonadota bacterium]
MTSAISIRVQPSQLNLIDQAAEVSGKNRTSFMLEASCANATNVLLDQRLFHLDEEAFSRFQAMLDAPVKDNPALRRVLNSKAPWE